MNNQTIIKYVKYIFLCIMLLGLNTSAYAKKPSALNQTAPSTELELFLFNIGFTSLMMDFEIAKEENIKRDKKIKKLQEEIAQLYKRDKVIKAQNKKIKELERNHIALTQEVRVLNQLLKQTLDRITILELSSNSQKAIASLGETSNVSNRFDRYEIVTETIPIRDAPRVDAKVLEYQNSGTILEIDFCTIAGWCKVHNSWSYVLKEDLRLVLRVDKSI